MLASRDYGVYGPVLGAYCIMIPLNEMSLHTEEGSALHLRRVHLSRMCARYVGIASLVSNIDTCLPMATKHRIDISRDRSKRQDKDLWLSRHMMMADQSKGRFFSYIDMSSLKHILHSRRVTV